MPFERQIEKLGKCLEKDFSKYQSLEEGVNAFIENLDRSS
jgi:uncharacterized FlgJ-related protein